MFSEAYGPIDEEHVKPTFVLNRFFWLIWRAKCMTSDIQRYSL